MNGLPGGVLYLVAAAQRCGRLAWVHEPALTAALTCGVRLPGGLLSCAQLWRSLRAGHVEAPLAASAVQLALGPFNTMYYAVHAVRRLASRPRRRAAA
jgi:hypothetical protein